MVKLYLDDLRTPSSDWTLVRTVEEVQKILQENVVLHMSLDHDLGYSYMCEVCKSKEEKTEEICYGCTCSCHLDAPTGYTLIQWMVQNDIWPVYKPYVHSSNPEGKQRMREDIEKFWHPPIED